MNSRNPIRARSLRAALLTGAGSTLLVAAMPAMAQDAPAAPQAEPEEEAIVVTGIRETIQNSINTKREETAIVDALFKATVKTYEDPALRADAEAAGAIVALSESPADFAKFMQAETVKLDKIVKAARLSTLN